MLSTKPKDPERNLVEACLLLDIYGEMLTERQRRFMRLHYEEDLSFSQIAREFGVSRQAVHDSVKHGLKALQSSERALRLLEKARAFKAESVEGEKGRRLRERLIELRERVAREASGGALYWIVEELDSLIASACGAAPAGE